MMKGWVYMRFGLSQELLNTFPEVCVGLLVVKEFTNGPSGEMEITALRNAEDLARTQMEGVELREHANVSAWRDRMASIGINPNKFKASIEALLARVSKGDALPSINAMVDLVNSVSLKYMLPAGAHDIGVTRGDIMVRPSRNGESFKPIGSDEEEVVPAGEMVYADDEGIRTRRWVWRQAEASKVHEGTTAVLIPIDGFHGVTDLAVKEAQVELARLIKECFGVEAESFFLDASNPCVEFSVVGSAVDDDPIRDLLERNVVDVIHRGELEAKLRSGQKLRIKFGIDPTGPKIHIGRAVPLRKLKQFQELGHQLVVVIGDFTAQIGDASDKSAARQMLTAEEVKDNMETYIQQMSKILDVSKVEFSYNSEWLGKLSFVDVLNLSARFTVAQMLERENFSERFIDNKPIGLQEFMYPLMQGYDSVALRADVELGGTDQLFNLMAGRELQRAFGQSPQAVMLTQLIPGTDGRKMSTSWGNTIAILDEPNQQYGKLMSVSDDLIIPYFTACTDVAVTKIREMAKSLESGSINPILLKKQLAFEVVRIYHGDDAARGAQANFESTVQNREVPQDMPVYAVEGVRTVLDVLVESGLVPSRSEARRLIDQGGVSLDGEKVSDTKALVEQVDEEGIVLRAGKRRYVKLISN